MIIERPEWHIGAECVKRSIPTDDFFGPWPKPHVKDACAACPVRSECLEWTLSIETREASYGYFGGTSARERQNILRQRAAAERAAKAAALAAQPPRRRGRPKGRAWASTVETQPEAVQAEVVHIVRPHGSARRMQGTFC